jgi:hypothetical protein
VHIVLISVAVIVLIGFYRFAIRGKFGRFPATGAGNALFQVHTLLRPSMQNVVEAKKQREEKADQGDDKPPELPPWARSSD